VKARTLVAVEHMMNARILVLALLCGCSVTGPTDREIIGVRAADPALVESYRPIYAAVEACVGRYGNFDSVRWWVADMIMIDGAAKSGRIEFPSDVIIHVSRVETLTTIRHEMVHHIMQIGNQLHDANGDVPCEVGAIS
jgi:hypothetical protein